MRIKNKDIPVHKQRLLMLQGNRCVLCNTSLKNVPSKNVCLDHCHVTGNIRAVLCRNCNGIEGKIYNLCNRGKREYTPQWYITNILKYWEHHRDNPSGILHPTHKTDEEKRIRRNKLARDRRKKKNE